MLDLRTKDRIRYHLDVPVAGMLDNQMALGLRWYTYVSLLEYRMNNLQAHEEADLTGASIGSVRIQGNPAAGDTITLAVGGASVTYTVTSADIAAQTPPNMTTFYSIALNIAAEFTRLNSGYTASGGPAIFRNAPDALPTYGEVIISSPTSAAFTITVSSTGGTYAFVSSQGTVPAFQFTFTSADGTTQVPVYGLVPILDYLDMQILQAMDNYSFTEAGIVKFRQDETQIRELLYQRYKARLSSMMGVPIAPMGNPNDGGGLSV